MNEFLEIADWMEEQNQALQYSHSLPDGSCEDPEIAEEVERVRRWIEFLRQHTSTGLKTESHT